MLGYKFTLHSQSIIFPFCVVTAVILIQGLNSSLFLAEALAVCLVNPNSSLNQVLPLEN